jgi:hypothetical protein
MRAILRRAAQVPSYLDTLRKGNLEPFQLVGDEISALTRSEIETFGRIVRSAKSTQNR